MGVIYLNLFLFIFILVTNRLQKEARIPALSF